MFHHSLMTNGKGSTWSNTKYMEIGGTDEYMETADAGGVFNFGDSGADNAFSMSCWFRPQSDGANLYIAAKGTTTPREWSCYKALGGTGALWFLLNPSSGTDRIYATSNSSLFSVNTWAHIVVTYDGSESELGLNIYVDGSDVTNSRVESGTYTSMTDSGEVFRIGRDWGGTYATADYDEYVVWDKELSSSEVSELYDSGSQTYDVTSHSAYSANAIAHWRMGDDENDDGTGSTGQLTDVKGSKNLTPYNTESGDIKTI